MSLPPVMVVGEGAGGQNTLLLPHHLSWFLFSKQVVSSVCRSLEADVSLLQEHTLRRTPTLQGLRPLRIAQKSTDVRSVCLLCNIIPFSSRSFSRQNMRDFQPFEGIRPAFSYSPGLHEEGQAPGGGGYSWEFLMEACRRFSKSWPYFRPKKFSDLAFIIHIRFQTWPPRNCIMLERQQRVFKSVLNSHITFSFLFIWNWNYQYVHTLPHKLYPFSDRNGTKTLPSTLWGGKYLYGLYKRVPSPRGGGEGAQNGW